MVQVLPGIPGFGERLGQVLGEALGNVGQGYAQGMVRKNAWEDFQRLNQPQGAPTNVAGLEGQTGPNMAQSGVQGLQAQQPQQSAINTAMAYEKLAQARGKPAADAWLAIQTGDRTIAAKESVDIRAEERKLQAEEKKINTEKKTRQSNIQKTFNVASSLLAKNAPGVGISAGAATGLNRKAVEGRAVFNNLKSKFESELLPMVNKGALSETRFKFILSQIPDASDSQRVIAGKLRGLAESLSEDGFEVDMKVLNSIPWVSKELKNTDEESSGRPSLESFFR